MVAQRLVGEGSIRQRSDGRWEARLGVAGKRYNRYALDQAGALAALHDLRGRHAAGTLTPPSKLTVGLYLAEWLTAHGPSLRPSTRESYGQLVAHLAPLDHLKVGRLEPRQVATLYAALMRQGLSAGRVRKLHAVLRKAFGDAVRWGTIQRNPIEAVDPPRPTRTDGAALPWSLADVRTFLALMESDDRPDARLLSFLLLSGLRLGEALALTWAEVDTDGGTVLIERGITHVHGKPVEGPPKTNAGVRRIALPAEAVAVLRRQRVVQNERRLAAGQAWTGGERVFTTAAGTAPLRGNVRRSLLALCARAGLPAVRVHDLRHLHATLMVHAGVDPKTLQRRLGHSSLRMTLGVYARSLPEADRQAADAFGRVVGG